jgi:Sulfotransferase family
VSVAEAREMTRSIPAFAIVGTPRSGTTLVQRLASELPGVRVPPETHFFVDFAPELIARRAFPLGEAELREEIRRFAGLETSRGLDLNEDAIVRHLGGRCERPVALFGAIVRRMAGDAAVYGEKTPDHLLWWRPLTAALPELKMVTVVRDPRAVVNSYRAMPFGMDSHVVLAERWNADQEQVHAMRGTLAPDRYLALRYERIVEDPEGARCGLARFLGVDDASGHPLEQPGEPALHMPWETWKAAASGPLVRDRAEAWRAELTEREAADIAAICRPTMSRLGYLDDPTDRRISRMRIATLSPVEQWRRAHFRLARRRRIARIGATKI